MEYTLEKHPRNTDLENNRKWPTAERLDGKVKQTDQKTGRQPTDKQIDWDEGRQ